MDCSSLGSTSFPLKDSNFIGGSQHKVLLISRQTYTEAIDLYNSSTSHHAPGASIFRWPKYRIGLHPSRIKHLYLNIVFMFPKSTAFIQSSSLQSLTFNLATFLQSNTRAFLDCISKEMVCDILGKHVWYSDMLEGIRDVAGEQRAFKRMNAEYGCKGSHGSLILSNRWFSVPASSR